MKYRLALFWAIILKIKSMKSFLKSVCFAGMLVLFSVAGCGPKKPAENQTAADTAMKDSAPSSDPLTQPVDTVYK